MCSPAGPHPALSTLTDPICSALNRYFFVFLSVEDGKLARARGH